MEAELKQEAVTGRGPGSDNHLYVLGDFKRSTPPLRAVALHL